MFETGIYYRAERNGNWENVDLINLTKEEVKQMIYNFGLEGSYRTVIILLELLREKEESS